MMFRQGLAQVCPGNGAEDDQRERRTDLQEGAHASLPRLRTSRLGLAVRVTVLRILVS